jgi:Xaa-Pro dipeptidase
MQQEQDWRINRIRVAMAKTGIQGLLSYAPGWRRENVRYLTGAVIRGSFALAYLPAVGNPTAIVCTAQDKRAILAQGWVEDIRLLAFPDCSKLIGRISEGGAPKKLGIAHLELMPKILIETIRKAFPKTEIVSATRMMDLVRLVKSNWELEQIRRSGEVCSAGWSAFVKAIKPGALEYEIIAAVESEIKSLGAEDNFMLIASGGKDVMGMTPPQNRRLVPGDMVRTELTPQMGGYYAQICRTAVLGEPTDDQIRSFELLKESLEAGLGAVHAGVTAREVAKAENDVFRKYGYGEYCTSKYTRVRGHGHGLHPDEAPSIIEEDETVLEENAVIIIHPNTYTPLAGYHVLGDAVVVTKNGYELLLKTERKLFTAPV